MSPPLEIIGCVPLTLVTVVAEDDPPMSANNSAPVLKPSKPEPLITTNLSVSLPGFATVSKVVAPATSKVPDIYWLFKNCIAILYYIPATLCSKTT